MITNKTISDKDIYFFKSHHFALLPWAEYKRKVPEERIYLISFDYHTDTIDPFLRYCNNDVDKMQSILAKVDYRKVDSIENAIQKLTNDEHICTAVGAGIIEGVYIVSYEGREIPCSYEEEERLKDSYGSKYSSKIIAGENVITHNWNEHILKLKFIVQSLCRGEYTKREMNMIQKYWKILF